MRPGTVRTERFLGTHEGARAIQLVEPAVDAVRSGSSGVLGGTPAALLEQRRQLLVEGRGEGLVFRRREREKDSRARVGSAAPPDVAALATRMSAPIRSASRLRV